MTNPPQPPGQRPPAGRYSAQNQQGQNPYGSPAPQGQPAQQPPYGQQSQYGQGGYPQGQPQQNPYGQGQQGQNPYGQGQYPQGQSQQPPAGYPQQGATPYSQPPAGGQPPYGQPPQGPYGQFPGGPYGGPPPKKSHLGLILGIIGGALVIAIVATIIGVSALSQQAQQSHGPVALPSLPSAPETPGADPSDSQSPDPEPTDDGDSGDGAETKGEVTRSQLAIGDCVKDVEAGRTTLQFALLDCADPHQAQVYASEKITGDDYPGEDALVDRAKALCGSSATGILDSSVLNNDYQSYYLGPSETTWNLPGERYLVCVVMRVDKDDFSGSKLKTQ